MPRLQMSQGRGARILLVDDDTLLLETTRRLLAAEGHELRVATTRAEAVAIARAWKPALLLLDYHLRGETGAEVVRDLREFDTLAQVLLVTGYAAERPARTMLETLDIQGYHDKSDGPERLLVLVAASLKHHATLLRVDRQRASMRHILDSGQQISRLQPLEQLFQVALEGVAGLLGAASGFIATRNNGLFVFDAAAEGVALRATCGRFAGVGSYSTLPPEVVAAVNAGFHLAEPAMFDGFAVMPVETRSGDRGCIVFEGTLPAEAVEPCAIYGRMVVQAYENIMLYERATVDALTEVHNRSYGMQRLRETLGLASRSGTPTVVLSVDIDRFKSVNDNYGHAAGDLVLRAVASAMRRAVRSTDVLARCGGEEFMILLPDTDAPGGQRLGERICAEVEGLSVSYEQAAIRVTVSVGAALAAPGASSPEDVLRRSDLAMYAAKRAGGNRAATEQPGPMAVRA